MNVIFLVATILLLLYLTIKMFSRVLSLNSKLTCTTGMMSAMIVGSMVGMVSGTVLALFFSYGINSLLAMIIGIAAGVVIAIPFNTMAILDGLCAGVMGGLMGAMLGEMLPTENFIYILSVSLMVVFVILFLLLDQWIKEEAGIQKRQVKSEKQMKHAFLIVFGLSAFACLIIITSTQFNKFSLNHQHTEHIQTHTHSQ